VVFARTITWTTTDAFFLLAESTFVACDFESDFACRELFRRFKQFQQQQQQREYFTNAIDAKYKSHVFAETCTV
jgi:hypothetical protein